MSGSAKAGTTAERQQVRVVDAEEHGCARPSEARVIRSVFPFDKATWRSATPTFGLFHGCRDSPAVHMTQVVGTSSGGSQCLPSSRRPKRLVQPTFWFLPSHPADAPPIRILDPVLTGQERGLRDMANSILEAISNEFASAVRLLPARQRTTLTQTGTWQTQDGAASSGLAQ
jgi:hypothetical protein